MTDEELLNQVAFLIKFLDDRYYDMELKEIFSRTEPNKYGIDRKVTYLDTFKQIKDELINRGLIKNDR